MKDDRRRRPFRLRNLRANRRRDLTEERVAVERPTRRQRPTEDPEELLEESVGQTPDDVAPGLADEHARELGRHARDAVGHVALGIVHSIQHPIARGVDWFNTYIIDGIVEANPAQVEQFKAGKEKVLGFFVGQVMKATQGKANPAQVNELLIKKLRE